MREDIRREIEANLETSLRDLFRLVRQRSVSAQRDGIEECAGLLRALMEEAGLEARVMPSPASGYPVVYGERRGRADRALLFYNHYDVQPPDPLDQWETSPFEPTRRGDKVYGRGISDDKGHLVSRLAAIKAWTRVTGGLPCTVKMIVEGCEEIGSPGLDEFVEKNRGLLRADGCVWEGGGVGTSGQPLIYLGCKGIQYVELVCETATRDSHSSYGPVVPNPAWRLVWALNTLKDANERILIPDFYDRIRPPTPQELAAVDALPPEDEAMRESLGASGFVLGARGKEWYRRVVFEPTCNIAGFDSGYIGEGSKTIVPARARAKLDFRLVPDMRPADVMTLLRAHLDRNGFGDISVTDLHGQPPARSSMDSPFVQAARSTAREVYGTDALVMPNIAGTGPMHLFTGTLGMPVVSAGVDYPDNRMHAPNENIRVDLFLKGTLHVAALLERFGS